MCLLEGIVPFHRGFHLKRLEAWKGNEAFLEYAVDLGANGEAAKPVRHHGLVDQNDFVVAADNVDGVGGSIAAFVNDCWGQGVVALTPRRDT